MSEQREDGGPAFPCEQGAMPDGTWNQTFEPGMSLRDWFAGQALSGMLAANPPARRGRSEEAELMTLAKAAYTFADFMLAARAKGGSQ